VGAMAQFAAKLRAVGKDLDADAKRQLYTEEAQKPGWARRYMKLERDDSFNDFASGASFLETGSGGSELCEGGADRTIDIFCLEEFVELAACWWLRTGIQPQIEAFRQGIEDVCTSPAIWVFEPTELRDLLCGRGADWTRDELEKHLKIAGGADNSKSLEMLINELDSMPSDRRARFVEFVTGRDRLPAGGLASACIRVVLLRDEKDTLPRSHTCSNELHLPEYSTPEIFAGKLMEAVDGSQGMDDGIE